LILLKNSAYQRVRYAAGKTGENGERKSQKKNQCNVAKDDSENNATLQKRKCNVAKRTTQRKKLVADEVDEVMENTDLNDKQKLFCIYYIRCFNATKAYQKAYGVDYTTAASISYRLLENDGVKNEIMRLKRNRLNRELLSEEDIVQRYIDIAYADISDYVVLQDGNIVFKGSDEFDGMLIKKVVSGKTNSIELHDSMKALKWLSDHMDLATEEQRLRIEKLKESRGLDKESDNVEVCIYLPDNERNDSE